MRLISSKAATTASLDSLGSSIQGWVSCDDEEEVQKRRALRLNLIRVFARKQAHITHRIRNSSSLSSMPTCRDKRLDRVDLPS
jgi:hypothetical protein